MARKKDAANAVMSSAILRVRENNTRIVSVPADATTARPLRYCSFTKSIGLRVSRRWTREAIEKHPANR